MDNQTKISGIGILCGIVGALWIYLEKKIKNWTEKSVQEKREKREEQRALAEIIKLRQMLLIARDTEAIKKIELQAQYLVQKYPQFLDAKYFEDKVRDTRIKQEEIDKQKGELHSISPLALPLFLLQWMIRNKAGRFILFVSLCGLIIYYILKYT